MHGQQAAHVHALNKTFSNRFRNGKPTKCIRKKKQEQQMTMNALTHILDKLGIDSSIILPRCHGEPLPMVRYRQQSGPIHKFNLPTKAVSAFITNRIQQTLSTSDIIGPGTPTNLSPIVKPSYGLQLEYNSA